MTIHRTLLVFTNSKHFAFARLCQRRQCCRRNTTLRFYASSNVFRHDDDDNDDGLNGYRKFPPTSDVLETIQVERQAAWKGISPTRYRQVFREICPAQRRNATAVAAINERPALGGSGKFAYRWIQNAPDDDEDDDSSRLYQRRSQEDPGAMEWKTVLPLARGVSLRASPSMSVDERFLAYIFANDDDDDKDASVVEIRHMETQETWRPCNLPQQDIVQVEFGALGGHGRYHELFLLQANEQGRPCRIWRSVWPKDGAPELDPQLLWSVTDDPRLFLHMQRTKGDEFVAVQAQSLDSNHVYLVGPDTGGTMRRVAPPRAGCQYHVDVGSDGDVFVLVQDSQTGHYLMETRLHELPINTSLLDKNKDQSRSTAAAAASAGYEISEIDLYRYWLVLYEASTLDGKPRIRVSDRRTAGDEWVVEIPHRNNNVGQMHPVDNANYDASSCRFQGAYVVGRQ